MPCLFRNPRRRPVAVHFDHERSSSDGGAVPVETADRAPGLTSAFAGCLRDRRQPSEVLHSLADMLRQRIYGLACGCEDCNDAGRLGGDPVFKLPLGRDPWQGRDLPSRPTLSRFENAGTADAPSALSAVPARCVVRRRHERRPETSIVELDFDPTCDPTYGGRQLALFNGFYDTPCYLPCYLPLVGAVRFDDERERHLVAALLRSGTAAAAEGLLPLLERLLPLLRELGAAGDRQGGRERVSRARPAVAPALRAVPALRAGAAEEVSPRPARRSQDAPQAPPAGVSEADWAAIEVPETGSMGLRRIRE